MKDYKKYLSINAGVRFGKPCVIGTRISVFDVLGWLASGISQEDIYWSILNWLKSIYKRVWLMLQTVNISLE